MRRFRLFLSGLCRFVHDQGQDGTAADDQPVDEADRSDAEERSQSWYNHCEHLEAHGASNRGIQIRIRWQVALVENTVGLRPAAVCMQELTKGETRKSNRSGARAHAVA